MVPAAPAQAGIGSSDVKTGRARHQPVQSHEVQPFGLHDTAEFRAPGGGEVGGLFGERERRDFNAGIADSADGAAGVGKRPFLEGFVADGVAKGQLIV